MTINVNLIYIVAGMMTLDVISGTLAAGYHHELNSKVAREGLFHKASFACLVALAIFLEWAQFAVPELGLNIPTTLAVCVLIITIELQSILENVTRVFPDDVARRIIKLFHLDSEKFDYLYPEIPFSTPDENFVEKSEDE